MSEWLTTQYHANIERTMLRVKQNEQCAVDVFLVSGAMAQEAMFEVLNIMFFEEV